MPHTFQKPYPELHATHNEPPLRNVFACDGKDLCSLILVLLVLFSALTFAKNANEYEIFLKLMACPLSISLAFLLYAGRKKRRDFIYGYTQTFANPAGYSAVIKPREDKHDFAGTIV
ncbi:hypothetical protein CDAR_19291 [Caerostris darwini]|uniref:Uncharacterized protein n=1 Tax=Caerostris darwini TaxID=1538125 RepID=A0AAV4WDG1_9ARAC|nr:hypothetical protein CDAR_19291 [Caerostris darwini]